MVQTSNEQQGVGNKTLSLGLDVDQLRQGLQEIGPTQMNAQTERSTVTTGKGPISGRLLALRSGARGLLFSDSQVDSNGALASADQLLAPNWRGGGAAADAESRWGGFVNINYNTGDRSTTERQFGFDFDSWGITGGVDYRFNPSFAGGVALTYDRNNADFKAGLGNVDSNDVAVSLYGTYTSGPFYVDGHFSYSRIDYDTRRNIIIPSLNPAVAGIDSSATGSTHGDQYTLTLGAGYDWKLQQNINVTPYGRLGYLHLAVGAFTETEDATSLGLDVLKQTTESLQSALGARISGTFSTPYGVLGPYFSAEWNHEFRDTSRSITAVYTFDPFRTFFVIPTDGPDRDFFTLSVGVSAQFARGTSGFINIDSVQGLSNVRNTGVTLGLRKEF